MSYRSDATSDPRTGPPQFELVYDPDALPKAAQAYPQRSLLIEREVCSANWLVTMPPTRGPDSPDDIWHVVEQALSAPSEEERWRLVGQLHGRPSPGALDVARTLCREPSKDRRRLGADILGQLGVERPYRRESIPVLRELLIAAEAPEVVNAAVVALGHLGGPDIVEDVLRFRDHPDSSVRHAVAFALGGQESPFAIDALCDLSNDIEVTVRSWATMGLGSLTDQDTARIRQALTDRLADTDDETRGEAMLGLARRADVSVSPWIERELGLATVGRLAVDAARELGDRRLLPALEALRLWWDVDPELLNQAVTRCSEP